MTNTCCDKCKHGYSDYRKGKIMFLCANPTCECHGVKEDHPGEEAWESEFDKEFPHLPELYNTESGYKTCADPKRIKSFIRTHFIHRNSFRKEVQGKKREHANGESDYDQGAYEAYISIINLLDKQK